MNISTLVDDLFKSCNEIYLYVHNELTPFIKYLCVNERLSEMIKIKVTKNSYSLNHEIELNILFDHGCTLIVYKPHNEFYLCKDKIIKQLSSSHVVYAKQLECDTTSLLEPYKIDLPNFLRKYKHNQVLDVSHDGLILPNRIKYNVVNLSELSDILEYASNLQCNISVTIFYENNLRYLNIKDGVTYLLEKLVIYKNDPNKINEFNLLMST